MFITILYVVLGSLLTVGTAAFLMFAPELLGYEED